MAVLEEARIRRLLGPMPLVEQVTHARGFSQVAGRAPHRWMDLGSGGGIPGLVLAWLWPTSAAVLLDSAARRVQFLVEAVGTLGWEERVSVVQARAEDAGRDPSLRGSFDLVVARSFGAPAVTAECAAPLLCVGGRLVVSEPPDEDRVEPSPVTRDSSVGRLLRWPPEPLAQLGLEPVELVRHRFGYEVLRQIGLCPERFPRRAGMAAKRPLYRSGT